VLRRAEDPERHAKKNISQSASGTPENMTHSARNLSTQAFFTAALSPAIIAIEECFQNDWEGAQHRLATSRNVTRSISDCRANGE
jgi:hypothetical protein